MQSSCFWTYLYIVASLEFVILGESYLQCILVVFIYRC